MRYCLPIAVPVVIRMTCAFVLNGPNAFVVHPALVVWIVRAPALTVVTAAAKSGSLLTGRERARIPGVTVTVVKPTGLVLTVVWATAEATRQRAAAMERNGRMFLDFLKPT